MWVPRSWGKLSLKQPQAMEAIARLEGVFKDAMITFEFHEMPLAAGERGRGQTLVVLP